MSDSNELLSLSFSTLPPAHFVCFVEQVQDNGFATKLLGCQCILV